ncbi:MAG: ArnT family glycosyltransferase [Anaerolineae bacterium]
MRRSIPHLAQQHAAFILVLVAFLGLGVTYSVVNPIFESPDEVWHYEYVRYLADGHGLPASDLITEMPWRQEGSQPPLYYLLGAALTLGIDTGDADAVIRYNPHAAVGLASAPDNKNMMAHTAWETFPYSGTVLAVHLVRLLSLLMGAATVLCTYLIALTMLPGQRALATVAAAINAFNPQFIFISAAVNNDNLTILLSSAAILVLIRTWQEGVKPGRLILLGVIAGLAAISKLNGLVLLPFIALVLVTVAWRRCALRALVGWGLMVGMPALAVAGWWYWRNWLLYRDPFGLSAMYAVLPARTKGPDLSELMARAEGVWRSTWAVFGWFNVVADDWLYAVYAGLTLVAVVGLGFLVIRRLRRRELAGLSALGWLALWIVVVVASLVAWSQKRYPQGRLLFPAISATSVLLAAGLTHLVGWLPDRWRWTWAGLLASSMLGLAVWVPVGYLAPTYAPAPPRADLPASALPIRTGFGEQVQLLGYELQAESVHPGEPFRLTLYWRALVDIDRDYSVFIHLVDDNELIVAQRDSYPSGGNAITSRWPVGPLIVDQHTVQIPSTAPAPLQTRLKIGLYDYQSGTRLMVADDGDSVVLGTVSILPAKGMAGVPNPVFIDFEGKLALIGFDLDRRAVTPGETLHLTLFWQAISPMEEDYTVFTHLLRPPDQIWAQEDDQPRDGQSPTSTWEPGEVIDDRYELALPDDAPPGEYKIEIGVYRPATGGRLKVGLSDQGIVLARVRVAER